MQGGIPVATVAVGKAGAKNAAYLAGQILALSDAALAKRIQEERAANSKQVLAKNEALQKELK
jgi:5-(carboxyamino)imidazole ribonucleotide mutase